MPLPEPKEQKLQILDFQGIDIERGVQVRSENSFAELENFDLVKPGVIRKVKGNKRLTIDSLTNDQVVALRDWQAIPGGTEYLVVVSAGGSLYLSGVNDDPITLSLIGDLYTPASFMDEAPYIVSLPFMYEGEKRQFIVVTVGTKGFPQKWDGVAPLQADITRLGIENPGDAFTEPYEHSLAAPQLFYLDVGTFPPPLSQLTIYLYATPNPNQGVPIVSGRQYRAVWYNPKTGHRSSLFPLHLGTLNYEATLGAYIVVAANKPLGVVQSTPDASFIMAVPLLLDNGSNHDPTVAIDIPSPGYTHIQIFATLDGGQDFFLVPRIFDKYGELITNEDGAISIDINNLNYGFGVSSGVFPDGLNKETPLYDGYIPLIENTEPKWNAPVKYDDLIDYTVDGAGQSGTTLVVNRNGLSVSIMTGYFALPSDVNTYRIVSTTGGANPTWTIFPALAFSPGAGDPITPVFIKPITDQNLLASTPFNDSGEQPFDRINDPPPMSSWGVVYQNRLFLLDAEDKTRVVYSRIGDYESFPPNNVFRFTQADFDPITALIAGRQVGLVSEGADQRLIIAKQQSTYQVTGTSILDFALTGLFPETGIVHKRAAITVGGFMAVLSKQGIMVIESQRPIFIGTKIKDLVDRIKLEEYGPCFAIDRRENQLLLGVDLIEDTPAPPAASITKIISMREPRGGQEGGLLSPFATINLLPTFISVIQESGFGDTVRMLMGGYDGHIYQLFTGGTKVNENNVAAPVVATAITQELPQLDKESRKLYRRVYFEGNNVDDDPGWVISFSVDRGVTYTDEIKMYDENLIGLVGKTLIVKIRHIDEADEDNLPQLSNMMLEYSVIGEAR